MALVKAKQYALFLLLLSVLSSYAFVNHPSKKEIRPDLLDIVDQQDSTQLKIQLHVGDENSGYLSVQGMIVQLGGRYGENEEEHVKLPGKTGPNAKCTSRGRRLNIVSKGNFINMEGLQHIDCNMGCWEMCWAKDQPAGMIIVAFNLPQTYSRNDAILPVGDMWLSFPVWTREGLKVGQNAKREVLDKIEMYDQKWNEELDKYEMTSNPIMRAIHERNAHIYATKCDELNDYSLETIPEDDQCSILQDDLLISKRGLIWKKDGKDDVLLGHAVTSPIHGRAALSSYSRGTLRP